MPATKTVSMRDLRLQAKGILGQVQAGRSLVLTYRGRPAMRLEPIGPTAIDSVDPFYRLAELAKRPTTSTRPGRSRIARKRG